MSRIGKKAIALPSGVKVEQKGRAFKITGPKGTLELDTHPEIDVKVEDNQIVVSNSEEASSRKRALHGTARALLNNMVVGVSAGFEKVLEINGVGYRAEMKGKSLIVHVGYSHPVNVEVPEGISFEVGPRGLTIVVRGHDKAQVGQVTADIRKIRPPEPYKGKGIKYKDERIRRKAGKAGKVS